MHSAKDSSFISFRTKANFLGSERMNEFNDMVDGSDACQDQIKKLVDKAETKVADISVNNDLLVIEIFEPNSINKKNVSFPICLLTYCGVLKETKEKTGKKFEVLEKINDRNISKPIFVVTFRNCQNFNFFDCFCFYFDTDKQAVELVKILAKKYNEIVIKYQNIRLNDNY